MMTKRPTKVQEAIAVTISSLAFFGGLAYGLQLLAGGVFQLLSLLRG